MLARSLQHSARNSVCARRCSWTVRTQEAIYLTRIIWYRIATAHVQNHMPANKQKNNERAANYQMRQELRALDHLHEELSAAAQLSVQSSAKPSEKLIAPGTPIGEDNIWQAPSSMSQLRPQPRPQLPTQLPPQPTILEDLLKKVEVLSRLKQILDAANKNDDPQLKANQASVTEALIEASNLLLHKLTIENAMLAPPPSGIGFRA